MENERNDGLTRIGGKTISNNKDGNRVHSSETGEFSSLNNAENGGNKPQKFAALRDQSAVTVSSRKINNNLFEPFFKKTVILAFVSQTFKYMLNPGEKMNIAKSTAEQDFELGIDFFLNFYNPNKRVIDANNPGIIDANDPRNLSIDLKTVESGLGNSEFYKNPRLTINLFKTYQEQGENGKFHESFMKEKSQNNAYAFMIPYSEYGRTEILENDSLLNDPSTIRNCKAMIVDKNAFRGFLNDRIINSEQTQSIIETMKQNRFDYDFIRAKAEGMGFSVKEERKKGQIEVKMPIYGKEGMYTGLALKREKNGVYTVRLYVPYDAFEEKDFKGKLFSKVRFRNA